MKPSLLFIGPRFFLHGGYKRLWVGFEVNRIAAEGADSPVGPMGAELEIRINLFVVAFALRFTSPAPTC